MARTPFLTTLLVLSSLLELTEGKSVGEFIEGLVGSGVRKNSEDTSNIHDFEQKSNGLSFTQTLIWISQTNPSPKP